VDAAMGESDYSIGDFCILKQADNYDSNLYF